MADQTRNQNRERENAPENTDETRGTYDEGGGHVEVFEHDEEDPDSAMSHEIGADVNEDEQTSDR